MLFCKKTLRRLILFAMLDRVRVRVINTYILYGVLQKRECKCQAVGAVL